MNPSVTAMLLTNGTRPEMLKRAAAAFWSQSYVNKRLLVINSGSLLYDWSGTQATVVRCQGTSIGQLRNFAAEIAQSDILVHWDDDDWSHRERLTEQVAFLDYAQSAAVGYRDMIFWDERGKCSGCGAVEVQPHLSACTRRGPVTGDDDFRNLKGEAWTYRCANPHFPVGTSLMYWRSAWLAHPFPSKNVGEEVEWLLRVPAQCLSSLGAAPRMIASIHGQNTSSRIDATKKEWRRDVAMDRYCAEVMKL